MLRRSCQQIIGISSAGNDQFKELEYLYTFWRGNVPISFASQDFGS